MVMSQHTGRRSWTVEHAWSIAFLPDGGILVTEKPGRLRLLRTAFGNPWTFPILWLASYRIGLLLVTGVVPDDQPPPADFLALFADITRAMLTLDIDLFFGRVWPVWYPMLIGSLFLAALTWIGTYLPARLLIAAAHERRRLVINGRKIR